MVGVCRSEEQGRWSPVPPRTLAERYGRSTSFQLEGVETDAPAAPAEPLPSPSEQRALNIGRSFAIVPAAGRSRRMGTAKLLLPWRHHTIVEEGLSRWKAAGVDHRIVVVHPSDMQLAQIARKAGAEVVVARDPPPDMKASVRLALEYVAARWRPQPADAWLLAPADIPELPAEVIRGLLAEHARRGQEILVPTHDGRRGHPVLFPWLLADDVNRLGENQGVNALLTQRPVCEVPFAMPRAADIDTPDDYARAKGEAAGG